MAKSRCSNSASRIEDNYKQPLQKNVKNSSAVFKTIESYAAFLNLQVVCLGRHGSLRVGFMPGVAKHMCIHNELMCICILAYVPMQMSMHINIHIS